ncbi:ribokinase [Aquicoccus sp. G2-2]|uniref:ribokinase n=1 Tax=Aquicoccus sp. G2-2 TaxID=3092120 RepID=UPI002ADF046D|nr:ribokinase [Aquicoccus sp. G2-2]MEA1114556.1 ribokinase [Aquicoccus sp. G2-2]
MTIFNLGSINTDHFYSVPHLPAPGETLAATGYSIGLGGKGANQSVAAAQAGAPVIHIGSVGPDGGTMVAELRGHGVDCAHVSTVQVPTAHAIINVMPDGENAITIFPGANLEQSLTHLESAISAASDGDCLILQNETNLQLEAARMADAAGLFVIYSAAPFSADAVQAVMPYTDLLVMNAVEAKQLTTAIGTDLSQLPVRHLLITDGARGATWHDQTSKEALHVPAFPVTPVDTTGAGDCFIGYAVAGLNEGMSPEQALRLATAASALQVQRPGTADAIPARAEVDAFLAEQGAA